MSRSIRGAKGPGFEYWSARPFNRCGGTISPRGGKHAKKRTHKAERQIGRAEAKVDPFTESVYYRCALCRWLSAERDGIRSWCVECDQWAEQIPVVFRSYG